MRVLMAAVGTRGDIQPAIALAMQLRDQGREVRLCIPPNFVEWARGLGFEALPLGIEMRAPPPGVKPVIPDLIANQFDVLIFAADGCDLIVGAGVHQYAARSVADRRGVPCVIAAYAPTSLPGADGAPPWDDQRAAWNGRSLERVNANRIRMGLAPIDDVLGHILGDSPWLAADPVLGPAPAKSNSGPGMNVLQTGAWLLADATPLSAEVEAFLEAGAPPVYVGFGSMPGVQDAAPLLIEAVRAAGRRVILARGWGELGGEAAADVLAISEANHQALFPRVAAVVHHGGAGTTTAAALAGTPQVIASMYSDQPYWGRRVAELGAGATLPFAGLGVESLTAALETALAPVTAERARVLAGEIEADGAGIAARRLVAV